MKLFELHRYQSWSCEGYSSWGHLQSAIRTSIWFVGSEFGPAYKHAKLQEQPQGGGGGGGTALAALPIETARLRLFTSETFAIGMAGCAVDKSHTVDMVCRIIWEGVQGVEGGLSRRGCKGVTATPPVSSQVCLDSLR